MNGSHSWKFIWWGTAGCASRATQVFLVSSGCEDLRNYSENCHINNECSHTHNQGIPKGMEDYPIICNLRNPYSLSVSSWLDETIGEGHTSKGMSFSDWVLNSLTGEHRISQDYPHYFINQWEDIGRRPNYFIRVECMEEDIKKIPFIPKSERYEDSFNSMIRVNSFKNENPNDEYRGEFQNFQKYYTKELADRIYETHIEYFEIGGYDKDSWKL